MIFHNQRNPEEMGKKEIGDFLNYLLVKRNISASTHNQALNALVFLYKKVLKFKLCNLDFKHSRIKEHYPVVLSREEVQNILSNLQGEFHLMASLLYGSGLCITECLALRIKDIDFELKAIIVRSRKGDEEHRTLLPHELIPHLKRQIEKAKIKFEENMLMKGFSGASVPEALETKYPNASKDQEWQYIFPSRCLKIELRSRKLKQHCLHKNFLQTSVKDAIEKAQITTNASCRTLRHCFAAHLLDSCYDIRIIQELLGHKDVRTTMMYSQVLHRNKFNVRSPLDK